MCIRDSLKDHVPAVFVPSYYSENGRITDIMAWRDGRIQNITLDPETGESSSTVRWYNQVSGTDINGDGIMELPEPYALPDPKQTTTAVNFWALPPAQGPEIDRRGGLLRVGQRVGLR